MLAVAVLAAGKGTRMKSDIPKVLQDLGGRSLVERALTVACSLQPERRFAIVGYRADLVEAALQDFPGLEFVRQEPQLGTGHAIQQLLEPLAGFTGELVVSTGDTPLLRPETLAELVDFHRRQKAAATVLTALLPDPTGYGRVFCDNTNRIEFIVEHRDCTEAQRQNRRVSAGIYCFDWPQLAAALPKLTTNNDQKEYYLTEVFNYLQPVYALDVADYEESLGINDRLQLARAHRVLLERVREQWMRAGVTMIVPESITIDDTVELAPNVVIEPQTHLRGRTIIGPNSRIGPGTYISDSTIGANTCIVYSHLEQSTVGDDCRIGPYARLRGEAVVGDRCRIGNFVELKHTTLGPQTTAAHLSYLGDATIGTGVNIGAGTVTANYDGTRKHPTVIGDRSKTGANSVLVAPVVVGQGANIAAGSVIVDNVPDRSLAIARARQVTKPDYYDEAGQKQTPSS